MSRISACKECGDNIRLGATRISVNRKRGVAHYLDHMTIRDCGTTKDRTCAMLKPYPKNGERPLDKMIDEWNKANAAESL